MTIEEVKERIRSQAVEGLTTVNHKITLGQSLLPPQEIVIIERTVNDGKLKDRKLNVWLIGEEPSTDGYKIVMRDDGMIFGLASAGFSTDRHPILVGWYGSLMTAFMSM
jgi:hypothetical protein